MQIFTYTVVFARKKKFCIPRLKLLHLRKRNTYRTFRKHCKTRSSLFDVVRYNSLQLDTITKQLRYN